MIDFDRKPTKKSEEEIAFDALNEKYTKKFGTQYVFDYAAEPLTWEETLADIRRRIDENDPQPKPEYERGVYY